MTGPIDAELAELRARLDRLTQPVGPNGYPMADDDATPARYDATAEDRRRAEAYGRLRERKGSRVL
jgi:hypothetical protein